MLGCQVVSFASAVNEEGEAPLGSMLEQQLD